MGKLIAKYEDHEVLQNFFNQMKEHDDKVEAFNNKMEELWAPYEEEKKQIETERTEFRKKMWNDIEIYLIKNDIVTTSKPALEMTTDGIEERDEDDDDSGMPESLKRILAKLKSDIENRV